MSFLQENTINFANEKNADIINHILKNHHRILKKELGEIEELIYTIFRVHFEDSGEVLEKVHKIFGTLKIELESHIIKEERSLFFKIKDFNNSTEESSEKIVQSIKEIKKSNEKVKELLNDLREITNDYTLPADTCPTYEKTFNKLKNIEKDTEEHLDLEDILFDRFL